MDVLIDFLQTGGFWNLSWKYVVMIAVGCFFIWLAVTKDYEPLLLVPIGFGILVGNVPFAEGLRLGVYEPGSVLNILYGGVTQGWYPPLIFLGIGAMTDFSCLLSNPRLILLGAAAQMGIFVTFIGARLLGFSFPQSGAIGIIGGRTVRRPSSSPHSWLPSCSARSRSPHTPTWPWCRSSSRRSSSS